MTDQAPTPPEKAPELDLDEDLPSLSPKVFPPDPRKDRAKPSAPPEGTDIGEDGTGGEKAPHHWRPESADLAPIPPKEEESAGETLTADPSPEETDLAPIELSPRRDDLPEVPGKTPASSDAEKVETSDEELDAEEDSEEKESEEAEKPEESAASGPSKTSEKVWLLALAVGILALGAFFYVFLRDALPSDSSLLPVESADLPVRGEHVVITALDVQWKRSADADADPFLFPQIDLTLESNAPADVRIFFRDERGAQVGDTIDIETGPAAKTLTIDCTGGLANDLEYDDRRSRNELRWTVELLEGPDRKATIQEFSPLVQIFLPWDDLTH